MASQTRTEGQRIAFLEGQIAHLATKADLAALEARLDTKIEGLRGEFTTMKWIIGVAIPAAIAITGIVVGIVVQVLNNLPGLMSPQVSSGVTVRADEAIDGFGSPVYVLLSTPPPAPPRGFMEG